MENLMKKVLSILCLSFLVSCFKADNRVVRGNLGDSKNLTAGGELNQTTGGAEEKFSLFPGDLSENALQLASSNSPSFNSELIKQDHKGLLSKTKDKDNISCK